MMDFITFIPGKRLCSVQLNKETKHILFAIYQIQIMFTLEIYAKYFYNMWMYMFLSRTNTQTVYIFYEYQWFPLLFVGMTIFSWKLWKHQTFNLYVLFLFSIFQKILGYYFFTWIHSIKTTSVAKQLRSCFVPLFLVQFC